MNIYGILYFQALSVEDREPFNEQAKRQKQNRKYGPQPDKMDCTGQYISVCILMIFCQILHVFIRKHEWAEGQPITIHTPLLTRFS